jgi:hypothetical protein
VHPREKILAEGVCMWLEHGLTTTGNVTTNFQTAVWETQKDVLPAFHFRWRYEVEHFC